MVVFRFDVFISDQGNVSLFPFTQTEEWSLARRSKVYHTISGHTARYILVSQQDISRDQMIEIAIDHNKGKFTDVDFTK
jgi:hypothetical protein